MSKGMRRGRAPDGVLAVLDIGTSKVTCVIAARETGSGRATGSGSAGHAPFDVTRDSSRASPLPVRVLGVGHHRSGGIKAGVVVDLTEAETCVREAIDRAERTAGLQVEQVVLSVACGRLKSLNFRASAKLGPHPLNETDIARVMAAGQSYAEREGRRLVHLNRVGWRLDGQGNIREPRGMRGSLIEADLHAITADETPLRNLLVAVDHAYVKTAGVVAAPFAAGLSVTSEEERHYGVTVVDMGAGLTTVSHFGEGHLLNAEMISITRGQPSGQS